METWSTFQQKKILKQKSQKFNSEVKSHHVKSNILCNIMPIYRLSKFCGLLPVRLVFRKAGRYTGKIDYLQVGYGIVLVLVLTGGQCLGLYRDLRDGWQSSTRLSSDSSITVTCSDMFAVMSVAIFVILDSPSRWQHLQRAFNKLVSVDEKLGSITSPNLRKISITVISCTLIYLIVISTLDFFSWGLSDDHKSISDIYRKRGPINYIPMYLMYLVIITFELQYAIVLFNIGERFLKLNQVIENLTKTKINYEFFRKDTHLGQTVTRNPKRRTMQLVLFDLGEHSQHHRSNRASDEGVEDNITMAEMIDQLITLHGILCDSVSHVNKAYGMAILMGTISCLVHLIITLYFLYNHIYSRMPNSWPLLFLQFFWILFHVYRLLLFVQPCHICGVKAKRTGALVNEALATDRSPEIKKQLKIFSIQLLQRPIEFTACGLFYLNRGLMTSIAGSVTTYLVILVQFQTADDTKGTKNLLENASELLKNVSSFKNVFPIK